ncbi:MAG TPA: ATP-binding protein [Longimicrobiales bacterium]|nr:ATP-binding protein [Longimicrobiales bacterium]
MPAPLRISLLYAAFGVTWILLGDLALWIRGGVSRAALLTELIKGGVFVGASALLLYILVGREVAKRQRSAAQLASVLETAPVGIASIRADGSISGWNTAATAILGWSEPDVLDRRAAELGLAPAALPDHGSAGELTVRAKSGEPVDIRAFTSAPDEGSDGARVLVFLDRRREIETEAALRRAQKLEAVGRLAGGIAHEFNNVLTTVIGHASMLAERLQDSGPLHEHVAEVRRSAERAAVLTRQLLVFSGKHITRTAAVDLTRMLSDMAPAIDHVAGENVGIRYDLAEEVWPVRCDVAQLNQLVLNLVVNAREAMPDGGTLMLETSNVQITGPDDVERVPPGTYVLLRVSDTGRGMSAETLAHLFEPFFTTKEQGTGLGLATVHGIVQQFDGHVRVQSRTGSGSSFEVFLPRAAPDSVAAPAAAQHAAGGATLLVVEDDDAVRDLTCRILRRSGHTVLSARNGHEALDVLASGTVVHLVIADIVMPGMNGVELGEHMRRDYPAVPILFTSGYVAPDVGGAAGLADGSRFLEKPYRPEQLVARVGELLA